MGYDRDLKWFMRVFWVLLPVNIGMVAVAAWHHDWIATGASMIWAYNVWCWRGMLRISQHTRNMSRLTDAAVLKVLAGDEQD